MGCLHYYWQYYQGTLLFLKVSMVGSFGQHFVGLGFRAGWKSEFQSSFPLYSCSKIQIISCFSGYALTTVLLLSPLLAIMSKNSKHLKYLFVIFPITAHFVNKLLPGDHSGVSSFNQFIHELSVEPNASSSVEYSSQEDVDENVGPMSPPLQSSRASRVSSFTRQSSSWVHLLRCIFSWFLFPIKFMLGIPLYLYGSRTTSGSLQSSPLQATKRLQSLKDHFVQRATDRRRGVVEVWHIQFSPFIVSSIPNYWQWAQLSWIIQMIHAFSDPFLFWWMCWVSRYILHLFCSSFWFGARGWIIVWFFLFFFVWQLLVI